MEYRRYVGDLRTGEHVFDRTDDFRLENRTDAGPEFSDIVREALAKVEGGEGFIARDVHLSRILGRTACVETTQEDSIIFAQRVGRRGLSRFVMNKEAAPTEHATVVLRRSREDDEASDTHTYTLLSAWLGELAPHEPWDPHADREVSVPFWENHAFVWGSKPTVFGTETHDKSQYHSRP